jgi:parvulin-like peptidyl-prolyl isomerase
VPEARVRHILLSTRGKSEDEQKRKADSLLTVVKRDRSKFAEMVTKFSEDPGSVSNGGVYEWFDKKQMVPEFTAASFDQKVGAITICKTSYGFHIVEVLGQRTRQERRIVTIDRPLKPSPATFKEAYKAANEFSLANKDIESIRKAAAEKGLQVQDVDEFRPDARFVSGLEQPASVIGWVNRAKLGEVSDPKDSGDNYVVAVVTGIKDEGEPELEDVREIFTREVVKEKKAEAFMARMQGKTDLPSLAAELGVQVQSANDFAYNNFNIPGGFTEYEVIGKIFALQSGQTSVPLQGENAVFVVNLTQKAEVPAEVDAAADRKSLQNRLQSRAENAVQNALREAAAVKDKRYMYY